MKQPIAIFLFVILTANIQGQVQNLKEQALEEFKNEQYNKAIALLERAAKLTPDDAEVFYFLGWFNHYRAYDSRPLKGYDFEYSTRIFDYLDKALILNPGYGDAKYFYGAECSANAFQAMQNSDAEKLKYYYKLADEKGAYPAWLKEFGRNFLNSCDKNAILFTGGNADFDVCLYLQLHEQVRTDITLIPIGNIDRPWYVRFLKIGLRGAVKRVDLNLTDEQILDMHPYKWEPSIVPIAVSEGDKGEFGLNNSYQLQWLVNPDLFSDRMHSQIESEPAKKRSYLSPQRAILLQLVEDNFSQRPICFSNFCSPMLFSGLEVYFQNCGLVSRLIPVQTKHTDYSFDYDKMENLLQDINTNEFKTLLHSDMPRISGIIVAGYYNTLLNLYDKYYKTNNKNAKVQLKQLFEKHLKIGYDPEFENEIQKKLR
jgi:hypothetical protein